MAEEYTKPMTLKELSELHAKKQPHQVEHLTEETPILDKIKFEKASHDLWNVYSEATDIKGAGFVEMNAALPKMGVDSELKKVDLSIMGGEIEVPEDTAQMFGGAANYFAKKTPLLLREAGNTTERKIIYDNFIKYSIDNGNAVDASKNSDKADSKLYSIACVRFVPGEVTGLYSEKGFANGAMLNVKPIDNGGLYKNENGVLVYGVRFKGYFGMQLANKNAVSSIVNIGAQNIPTEAQLDDLLINARASLGSTFLMMHPKMLSMLNRYKGELLKTTSGEYGINRTFTSWNGIPIITSYNFLDGAETKQTVKE
jgi:hypothetical protein